MRKRNEIRVAIRAIRRASRDRSNARAIANVIDAIANAIESNASNETREIARTIVDASRAIAIESRTYVDVDASRFAIANARSNVDFDAIRREFDVRTRNARVAKTSRTSTRRASNVETSNENANASNA